MPPLIPRRPPELNLVKPRPDSSPPSCPHGCLGWNKPASAEVMLGATGGAGGGASFFTSTFVILDGS